MNPLSWKRNTAINYHYEEGKSWLANSKRGKQCTALSYAAFEFRLALERIIFQYWYTINENDITTDNITDARSFKRMQSKIYKFGGYQKQINKYFEFMQIILDSLELDIKLIVPNLGQLHKNWQNCSELCHINWTMIPKTKAIRKGVVSDLEKISDFINEYVSGLMSWPNIAEENFEKIQQEFVTGACNKNDVLNYLNEIGMYAVLSDNKNEKSFIGTAIEPNANRI